MTAARRARRRCRDDRESALTSKMGHGRDDGARETASQLGTVRGGGAHTHGGGSMRADGDG